MLILAYENRQAAAKEFAWLQFKPEVSRQLSIPDAPYPVSKLDFEQILAKGGDISINDIVRGLMGWLDVTDNVQPVAKSLRRILQKHFPPSDNTLAGCEFETEQGVRHRFRVGPIDPESPHVTWQRKKWVVAIGSASELEPGRLTLAAPVPITLKTARSIFNHAAINRLNKVNDGFEAILATCAASPNRLDLNSGQIALVSSEKVFDNCGKPSKFIGCDDEICFHHTNWLAPNQIAAMVAIGNGFL